MFERKEKKDKVYEKIVPNIGMAAFILKSKRIKVKIADPEASVTMEVKLGIEMTKNIVHSSTIMTISIVQTHLFLYHGIT